MNQFPEYDGVDILESRGITLASGADGYASSPVARTFDYVNLAVLSAAQYGSASGLPDGADVYRLELPTLLPGGDFESGPGLWTASAPVPTVLDAAATTGAPLDGTYLEFEVSASSWGRVDLSGFSDAFVDNAIYHIQFDVYRASSDDTFVFDYGDNGTESYINTQNKDWVFSGGPGAAQEASFPGSDDFDRSTKFAAATEDEDYFYVGSAATSSVVSRGFLDNLRFGRVDVLPHHVLTVDPTTSSGLDLISGQYVFSIYVKSEIDAEVTPTTPDRFRAGQLSIGINDQFNLFEQSTVGWNQNTWVQVSVTTQLSEAALASPLRIQLTTTDAQLPAVGSVLISSPRLELQLGG